MHLQQEPKQQLYLPSHLLFNKQRPLPHVASRRSVWLIIAAAVVVVGGLWARALGPATYGRGGGRVLGVLLSIVRYDT